MIHPPMSPVDDVSHEEVEENKDAETRDDKTKDAIGHTVVTPKKLRPILRPPPPF